MLAPPATIHSTIKNNQLKTGIGVLTLLFIPYLYLRASFGGDFLTYLGAAQSLANGINCYNQWFTYQGVKIGVQYSYSPFFAWSLIPLIQVPYPVVLFAFLLLSLLMFWRIGFIIYLRLQIFRLSEREQLVWSVLLLVSVLRFLLHNFEMVQINLMLLYFCVEGLYQIQRGKKAVGGVLLGLGIGIKLLPVVLVPYLIYRKEGKAFLFTTLAVLGTLALPFFFFETGFTKQLFADWWNTINPLQPRYTYLQNEYGGIGIQSLASFLAVYFSNQTYQGFSLSLVHLAPQQLTSLIGFCVLALTIFTFYFLKPITLGAAENNIRAYYEQAYLLAVTPLIFPHQQKYAFIFLMPAYAFVYAYVLFTRKEGKVPVSLYLLIILTFVLLTITTDGLTGKWLGGFLQYARVITIGSFLIILLLALVPPPFRGFVARMNKGKEQPELNF